MDFNFQGNTQSSGGSNYFATGFQGVLVSVGIKAGISRKDSTKFIAGEFRVLETNMPQVHPVGSAPSHTISFKHASAEANYVDMLCGLSGVNPKDAPTRQAQITPDVCRMAYGQHQPFNGRIVALTTHTEPTKAGGDFTKHVYTPVDQAKYLQLAQQVCASPVVAGLPPPRSQRQAGPPAGFGAGFGQQPQQGYAPQQQYQQPAPQQAAPYQGAPPANLPWNNQQQPQQAAPQQQAPAWQAAPQQPQQAPQSPQVPWNPQPSTAQPPAGWVPPTQTAQPPAGWAPSTTQGPPQQPQGGAPPKMPWQ
jgi:hypothetical protein